eukprot:5119735-Pleurochrysis_carterae.AAC.3
MAEPARTRVLERGCGRPPRAKVVGVASSPSTRQDRGLRARKPPRCQATREYTLQGPEEPSAPTPNLDIEGCESAHTLGRRTTRIAQGGFRVGS